MLFVKVQLQEIYGHVQYLAVAKPLATFSNILFKKSICYRGCNFCDGLICIELESCDIKYKYLFEMINASSILVCYDYSTAWYMSKMYPKKEILEIEKVFSTKNPVFLGDYKDVVRAWVVHATELALSAHGMRAYKAYSGK